MQLFVLHKNPRKAAQLLADVHVVKILLEAAQLLNNVWVMRSAEHACDYHAYVRAQCGVDMPPAWKIAHAHHPLTQWLLAGACNFTWTLHYALALLAEYTRRFGYFSAHRAQTPAQTRALYCKRQLLDKPRSERRRAVHSCEAVLMAYMAALTHCDVLRRMYPAQAGAPGDAAPAAFCVAIPPEYRDCSHGTVAAYRRYYVDAKFLRSKTPLRWHRGARQVPAFIRKRVAV
jgi:hypothetical protein